MPVDAFLDIINPVEIGPALPGMVLLQTIQESFRDVISYRAYGLLKMRQYLWFDEIKYMTNLGMSIQSSFPHLQAFSGVETVK